MSDNYDDLIGSALGEFHTDEATSAGPITSSGAIRATVAHRRKVRITTFSVLGVLLLAAPIAAFAANPRGNNSPPINPANSPTATVSVTPTAKPITAEELIAAKVAADFGDYDCDNVFGPKPSRHDDKAVYVEKLAHLNLDGDPDSETVVVAYCDLFENSAWQVLGFDRDAAGKIVVMGKVTQGLSEHVDVDKIAPRTQGGMILTLADYVDSKPTTWRARSFVWDGTKFAEVQTPPQGKVTGPSIDDIVAAKINMSNDEFACQTIVAKPKSFVAKANYVEKILYTNLDTDPELETAALLKCHPTSADSYQWDVVAFDKNAKGEVVFVGGLGERFILEFHTDYVVTDVEARPAGGIVATIRFPSQGNLEQQREYAWKNGKFTQVGGPTSPAVYRP